MNRTLTANPLDSRRVTRRRVLRHGTAVTILGAALITLAARSDSRAEAGVSTAPAARTATPPAATTTPAVTGTPTTSDASHLSAVRPSATVDELVSIEDGRLHVRCIGSGATTILLIAGFESGDGSWGPIEPAISQDNRVCSYARFGTGTSDPPVSTQTFTTQATDLHALLTTVGEPGPYVVVGHSFGGAEAVTFASLFADEVTGLVLIDASPVTWPEALCSVPDDGSDTAATLEALCTSFADPTSNAEHLDVIAAFGEVSNIGSLGSLPMSVITATDRQLPGLGAGEVERLTDIWNEGQRRWASLSTASRLVPVENTSHHIEIDRPDVVLNEVARLLP
jgi:pimeloyl-ACP methyl ester carboxylesterase